MIDGARRVRVAAFGFFDETGFGGTARSAQHPPVALTDLTWPLVSPESFKRFGQLDAIAKCALTAIEAAGVRGMAPEDTAICAATAEGCLGADMEFAQSLAGETGPSPRLFAYTLPSTVCGEIAIQYGWKGPNLCLVSGDSLRALIEGYFAVATGDSPACLSVGYDALFASSAAKAAERGMLLGDGVARAYAFLLRAGGVRGSEPGWFLSPGGGAAAAPTTPLSSLRAVKDLMVRGDERIIGCLDPGGVRGRRLLLHYEADSR